jgi:uncharacterized protein (TIGR00297 family)
MAPGMQVLLGFILGAGTALLAWRLGVLSPSGALAAALTGGLVFGLGGIPWAILLLLFFITSSGLSHLSRQRKTSLAEKFSKGSRRDWGQVAANGGLATLLVLLHGLLPEQDWIWAAYAGSLAAVNADTWATELGVLSRKAPRLLTTGKVVERGTSGGVSLAGTLAALGGATLLGLAAGLLAPVKGGWSVWLAASLGGLAGSLFDSWLGASVQAIYHCPACGKETERHPLHTCGVPTEPLRGWRWLNNDLVNVACALVGSGLALGVWYGFTSFAVTLPNW